MPLYGYDAHLPSYQLLNEPSRVGVLLLQSNSHDIGNEKNGKKFNFFKKLKIEFFTVIFRFLVLLQTAYLHICCDQSDHVVVESIKSFRSIQSD